ncbi:MAG TPA: o-succinylbenzoate--CoA ligase [Pseudonocardiaceae bacterium]|nr:o-succinylbenzoate--CoA ligase [Pseudonocardiaceae bacterium]
MREVLLDGRPPAVAELTAALTAALDGSGPVVLPLDAAGAQLAEQRAAVAPDQPVEPDTALIISTSGSTGAAKGVLLSAGALIASADATHARLGGPGRWLVATPTQYIGGVQVLVRSLRAGTTPGVVDLSVPFRAEGFADAAKPVLVGSGPWYTAMVPTQLAQLLAEGGVGLAALRSFDAVIIGAAALSARLADRAAAARVRVVRAYGMSETASGCVYDGRPLDGVRVRLTGDAGRVEIAGPVLANGYRRDPELTAKSFVDDWFVTGDAAVRHADGRIEILGRTDDLINTGGVKVAPVLVERVLAALPGVREACVVAVPDDRWGQAVVAAIVPTEPGALPAEDDLRAAVRAEVGRAAVPKRFTVRPALPLRGPGKIDRAAVRAWFTRPS